MDTMTFTVEVPKGQAKRVLDAVCAAFGYGPKNDADAFAYTEDRVGDWVTGFAIDANASKAAQEAKDAAIANDPLKKPKKV